MAESKLNLKDLLPEGGRVLLTGGGKAFIERIGVDAAKHVILSVLKGENLRTQTEPLTRRRIAQISGAMVYLFARGWTEIDGFTDQISDLAIQQSEHPRRMTTPTFGLRNGSLVSQASRYRMFCEATRSY
jgi:hypothetical protein